MITEHWNNFIDKFPVEKRDIYFTEEYHCTNASREETPKAFVYTEDGMVMVFPFLSSENKTVEGIIIKDFESAYGYGGPIYNTDNEDFIKRALYAFKEELTDAGYIAGFVRFHPLMNNHCHFDVIGDLLFDRNTIAIDLTKPIENVWMNEIHTKNRNVIKKGQKEGLVFKADDNYKSLARFRELYESTMDKLNADSFYYFDDKYFQNFKQHFPNSFIGEVSLDGKDIASAIFFYDGIYGHYHLAGSNITHLKLSPNNFLLWEAAKELKNRGVKYFHLGGGINSDETNSLFQFKRKFSKSTRDFYIGKLVFAPETYSAICQKWEERNPGKVEKYGCRLLKYRY